MWPPGPIPPDPRRILVTPAGFEVPNCRCTLVPLRRLPWWKRALRSPGLVWAHYGIIRARTTKWAAMAGAMALAWLTVWPWGRHARMLERMDSMRTRVQR